MTLEMKCGSAWGQPRGGWKEGRVPGPCGGAQVAAWGPGDGQCGSVGSRVRRNLRADHSDEMQLYFFKCEVSG